MQTKQKDKMMKGVEQDMKNKQIRLFHFSGNGTYKPLSVEAENKAEAEEQWKKKRTKISHS